MDKITLYHTSDRIIPSPDILHSRDYLDFGKGFYLTTIRAQAESYGNRFKRRNKEAWLNIYNFDYPGDNWNLLRFNSYNTEWLNFVAKAAFNKNCLMQGRKSAADSALQLKEHIGIWD